MEGEKKNGKKIEREGREEKEKGGKGKETKEEDRKSRKDRKTITQQKNKIDSYIVNIIKLLYTSS